MKRNEIVLTLNENVYMGRIKGASICKEQVAPFIKKNEQNIIVIPATSKVISGSFVDGLNLPIRNNYLWKGSVRHEGSERFIEIELLPRFDSKPKI